MPAAATPNIPDTVPDCKFSTIPNDAGLVLMRFDHDPKLVNCDVA